MKEIKEFLKNYNSLLKSEQSYFLSAIIYGVAISILMLAIPISVQALVNTIAFGVLLQPLLILSLILLCLLIFSGILKALQAYTIELFQRKFYIKISTDIAENLMLSDKEELTKHYSVELVNRYFDIMTVQKKATTLLINGSSLLFQIGIGLIILAIYHPYFLIFDLILVFLLYLVWFFFGERAMKYAREESNEKYSVAFWLEEIARENQFFKKEKFKTLVYSKTNDKVKNYLQARKLHFKNLFFQIIFLLVIYAFLSSLILALGGYLVTINQLSLGQLVAAELIITVILTGLSGAGKYLEDFYDLHAGMSKVSTLYKLKRSDNLVIEKKDLDSFDLLVKLSDNEVLFEHGKLYLIQSQYYSSKLNFVDLIRGFKESKTEEVFLGGMAYHDLNAFQINNNLSIIMQPHYFDGSILENLTAGKTNISKARIQKILEVLDLAELENALPQGLNTKINPNGYPLWPSQLMRLTIARELLSDTKIIVGVDFLDGLEEKRRIKLLEFLSNQNITFILLSNREFEDISFDQYFYLKKSSLIPCKDLSSLRKIRKSDE